MMTYHSTAARKGLALLKILLLTLICVPFTLTASAQDAQVMQIPVRGRGVNIALSPDGTTLAVAQNAALLDDAVDPQYLPIQLIDISTGKAIGQLEGNSDYIGGMAFSPDGKTLATSQNNGVMDVWDVASQSLKSSFVFSGPSRGRLLQFLPDNRRIVMNEPVPIPSTTVWDTTSGAMVKYLVQHFDTYDQFRQLLNSQPVTQNYVSALAVSPDGKTIVTAIANDDIWLWNVDDGTGQQIVTSGITVPYFDIRQISFSPNGSTIYYFQQQTGVVHGLDVTTGIDPTPIKLDASYAGVSPDGQMIASVVAKGDSVTFQPTSGSGSPVEVKLPSGVPINPTLIFTPDSQKLIINGTASTGDEIQSVLDVVTVPAAS